MHKLVVCGLLLTLAVGAGVAGAKPLGTNGMIAFTRFNPTLGTTQVYVVNPDGTHERQPVQGQADAGACCPKWFSDGVHIAFGGSPVGLSRIINPDDGTYRDVGEQDPNLFNPCGWPSPDGKLLLCETFSEDGSQNGLHVVRSSDGGGLRQITSIPGGDDVPGSWSPNGKRIVFERHDAVDGTSLGLFAVNVNGTGLRQITTVGTSPSDWSSQGNEIVFSRHGTPDARSSIWVMHADGSGLHEVHVQAQPACGGAFSDPDSQGCFDPSWSPDGTKIVFSRGTSGDFDSNLFLVNTDGSGFVQITHGASAEQPDWGTHPVAR